MANINLSQLITESLISEDEKPMTTALALRDNKDDSGSSIFGKAKHLFSAGRDKLKNASPKSLGKIAAGTAAAGAVAYGLKKGVDHLANKPESELSRSDKAKAFATKHGGKVAAGTLAALGAGVGVKALLKYLRNKKRN